MAGVRGGPGGLGGAHTGGRLAPARVEDENASGPGPGPRHGGGTGLSHRVAFMWSPVPPSIPSVAQTSWTLTAVSSAAEVCGSCSDE